MTDCRTCDGEGWVCEDHPDKPWGNGKNCCGGAGMPCRICNPSDYSTPPRMPPGTTEIWHRDKGWIH